MAKRILIHTLIVQINVTLTTELDIVPELGDELADGHDEKEEVEEELELVIEDERQEGEHAVLLVADHVGRELGRGRCSRSRRWGRTGRAGAGWVFLVLAVAD